MTPRTDALQSLEFAELCEKTAAAALATAEAVLAKTQALTDRRRAEHTRAKQELERARFELRKACGLTTFLDDLFAGRTS